jgi:ribosomal protein L21E
MKFKEGDRVRIITRPTTPEDKVNNRYYEFMGGLTGSIQNIYNEQEVAVRIDPDCLSKASRAVHKEATVRMRTKALNALSEVQKKELTAEEMEFEAHFMLLIHGADLEAA